MTTRAVADALVPIFGVSSKTIQGRLNTGELTKAECEVIGSYFEMSMKEYYDVFMNGLFVIDQNGNYVCHVEEPYKHIHYRQMTNPTITEKQINSGKINLRSRNRTAKEILEQLEKY